MKKIQKFLASLVCIAALFLLTEKAESLSSGTLARYRGYLWNGIDYSGYLTVRDGNNNQIDVSSQFITNQLYFIYGVYPKVNVLLNVDVGYSYHEGNEDFNLSDGQLGVKYQLYKPESHLYHPGIALFASIGTPLSDYNPNQENALGEGYTQLEFVAIFDYEFEFEPFPLELAIAPGYRLRFTSGPSQFFLEVEFGLALNSYIDLQLKSYLHYSFSGIEYREEEYERIFDETGDEPIPRLRSIYSNITLGLEYHIFSNTTLGLQVGYVIYVENAPELYQVGLSYGRLF